MIIVIAILEIVGIAYALSSKNKIRDSYRKGFETVLIDAYLNADNSTIDVINNLQDYFSCCGGYNSTDYTLNNITIPNSCYSDESKTHIFNEGCADAVIDWIEDKTPGIIAVLALTFVIEILLTIFAIIFGRAAHREGKYSRY